MLSHIKSQVKKMGLFRSPDQDEMFLALAQVEVALARAAAVNGLRHIDEADPQTWGFSGFSQNEEDGIIDVLLSKIKTPNYYFLEIGASDGLENNTSWLAIARRFQGIMIEGNPVLAKKCQRLLGRLTTGPRALCLMVDLGNASQIVDHYVSFQNPDVFSLDIDGYDYYLARALFDCGLRPKICVVEYNAALGPDNCLSVPYKENYSYLSAHTSNMYYGCSIAAWKKFFDNNNYAFVTVERNGVNAFFIDRNAFDSSFIDNVKGVSFNENVYQLQRYRAGWQGQLLYIKDMLFDKVD